MIVALALLQNSTSDIQDANEVVWARQTSDHDRYWIMRHELRYEGSGSVVVWMHGDHRSNPSVNYRTSLWRIRFACDGTMQLTAVTTLDARGNQVSSWDGYQSSTYIRPGTIYESIEKGFCLQRR
jgi:hypothetical protein